MASELLCWRALRFRDYFPKSPDKWHGLHPWAKHSCFHLCLCIDVICTFSRQNGPIEKCHVKNPKLCFDFRHSTACNYFRPPRHDENNIVDIFLETCSLFFFYDLKTHLKICDSVNSFGSAATDFDGIGQPWTHELYARQHIYAFPMERSGSVTVSAVKTFPSYLDAVWQENHYQTLNER